MKYKITGGTLLRFQGGAFVPVTEDLYIADGKIVKVGSLPSDEGYERVDAKGRIVLPGLVNMHTHAYMSFMRNYADDVSFDEWLFRRVMPVEDKMTGEDAYWSTLFGCMEMIRSGTTCMTDMHMFAGFVPRAVKDAGMRAYIGRGLVGESLEGDGKSRYYEAMAEAAEYASDRIRFLLAPHAIYTCGERLLREVSERAASLGMLKEIHLAESEFEHAECVKKHGVSPVKYLANIGFLDDKTLLAHCVKVSAEDMDVIAASGAHVVTNPASNAKLGNGVAPVAEMLSRGINVCIGTDGAASNNTQNLFREMTFLSLLQKATTASPLALSAEEVLRMGTVNAARALGAPIGAIEEGAAADLVFLDADALSLNPANDVVTSLVYSANGSEVRSVMIDGAFVLRENTFTTIDSDRVLYEARRIAKKYL